MDNRSVASIKFDALVRMAMQNTLSRALPIYLITEYQKSGGTWIGQMLAAYLDLPFPRNRIPKMQACILHGHVLPTPFLSNVLCVYRDGRDAVVSSYFHMLFENDKNSPHLVKRVRSELNFTNYDDVRGNLPVFIKYLFTAHHKRTLFRPNQFTWTEFVSEWRAKAKVSVKYEDMVEDGVKTLAEAVLGLTGEDADLSKVEAIVEQYSFRNQSNREAGTENTRSFLRKGQPGDWREKFSREAALTFNEYGGQQLIELGYEQNSNWLATLCD